MSHIDDVFKNMRNAPIGRSGGTYMQPGLYEVEIKEVKTFHSKDPRKLNALMFACEFTVRASGNPAHEVGTSGSWVSKFDQWGYTLGDCKALLFAAIKGDPRKPEDHVLAELLVRAICDETSTAHAELKAMGIDNAAEMVIGERVALECVAQKKKAPGAAGEYTKYSWSALKDSSS